MSKIAWKTQRTTMTKNEIKNMITSTVTPMFEEERAHFSSLEVQIQYFDNRFNQIVDLIKLSIDQVNKRFETIDKRFELIEKRFEAIDKRFEAIDNRFELVEKRFDAIDKRFEDMYHYTDKRFEDLNKRMNFQTWFIGIGLALVMGLMTLISY